MRILVCPPDHFGVDYVINPWMEGQLGRVDQARARAQWEALFEDVSQAASIEEVAAEPGCPDMCFTANAGLVLGGRVVPSRFRMAERESEERPFECWFRANGLDIQAIGGDPFEGEGDALFQPGEPLLWAGYGVRTSLATHPLLASSFDVEVVSLRLVDQRFYHLDTCFTPLPDGRLMYSPTAFDERSRNEIERRIPRARRIEVDEADALGFACNALRVGDRLFMNAVSPELKRRLAAWGFETRTHRVDEFLKAGGGVKCLSLLLGQSAFERGAPTPDHPTRSEERHLVGHLLDAGLLRRALDAVTENAGSFRIDSLDLAERKDQLSRARLRITAPDAGRLETILAAIDGLGATRR